MILPHYLIKASLGQTNLCTVQKMFKDKLALCDELICLLQLSANNSSLREVDGRTCTEGLHFRSAEKAFAIPLINPCGTRWRAVCSF
jgi:hypothetical protein